MAFSQAFSASRHCERESWTPAVPEPARSPARLSPAFSPLLSLVAWEASTRLVHTVLFMAAGGLFCPFCEDGAGDVTAGWLRDSQGGDAAPSSCTAAFLLPFALSKKTVFALVGLECAQKVTAATGHLTESPFDSSSVPQATVLWCVPAQPICWPGEGWRWKEEGATAEVRALPSPLS